MNEYMILAISFISGVFGLIGIQLLQHNWFKREDMKFKFDLKRAKIRAKNVPIKKTATPTGAMDWLSELKKVNPDTLHELIDAFGGGGEGRDEDMTDILGNIVKSNPELVQKFLGNLGKDNKVGEDKYV